MSDYKVNGNPLYPRINQTSKSSEQNKKQQHDDVEEDRKKEELRKKRKKLNFQDPTDKKGKNLNISI